MALWNVYRIDQPLPDLKVRRLGAVRAEDRTAGTLRAWTKFRVPPAGQGKIILRQAGEDHDDIASYVNAVLAGPKKPRA